MKDLYTFDASLDEAAATYKQVRIAYSRIFDRILNIDPTASEASSKRPFQNLWSGWKAAEADTGAIGGHRSHEYHMEDPAGEDHLLSCSNTSACTYAANVERAISLPSARTALPHVADEVEVRLFGPSPTSIGKGAANLITGGTLHAVLIRKGDVLNEIKVNKQLASAGLTPQPVQLWSDVVRQGADWDWVERPEGPLVRFTSLEVLVDRACSGLEPEEIEDAVQRAVRSYSSSNPSASKGESTEPADKQPRLSDYFPAQLQTDSTMASAAQLSIQHVDLRTAVEGDTCASCGSGQLIQHRAVEVGHTFLLGTRYSDALDVGFAPVAAQSGQSGAGSSAEKKAAGSPARIPFQMGCYGIGVTRLIGILAQRAVRAFEMAQSGAGRATAPTASSSSPAGLLWPPSVAPFQTVIVLSTPITPDKESASESVVNKLIAGTLSEADFATAEGQSRVQGSDVLVDDRPTVNLGAKLKDADLIGSSQVIVIGKHWEKTGEVEVRTAGQAPTFVKV
ncbi:hypothetical protein OC861_001905 [Tilletia horrida]|nr:hypothetical protein OC861_001905 [Tilletia horrida]